MTVFGSSRCRGGPQASLREEGVSKLPHSKVLRTARLLGHGESRRSFRARFARLGVRWLAAAFLRAGLPARGRGRAGLCAETL